MFDSFSGDFDIQKEHVNSKGDYVITAGLNNNGILGRSDIEAKIIEKQTFTIDMFGFAFYRSFQYKMVTHARVFSLKPKFNISDNIGLFIVNSFKFLQKKFGYENMCSWKKIKDEQIKLPIKNEEIDFEFMEDFIKELEEIKLNQIKNYLKENNLDDLNLTKKEKEALEKFKNGKVEWGEFRIEDLFEKMNLKRIKKEFDKDNDLSKVKTNEFNVPLVNAKDGDNGIMYYGRNQDFESIEMSIDIVNDGAVSTGNVYPQPKKTGVLYNAYLIKAKFNINEKLLYFFASSIYKSIKHKFGYENKAGWEKVKNEQIKLPIKDEKIDFEFMENLISAIQKNIIKKLKDTNDS